MLYPVQFAFRSDGGVVPSPPYGLGLPFFDKIGINRRQQGIRPHDGSGSSLSRITRNGVARWRPCEVSVESIICRALVTFPPHVGRPIYGSPPSNQRNQPMPGKPLDQMTDRDLFAALALQALLTGNTGTPAQLAANAPVAVQLADALLAALNGEGRWQRVEPL